MLASGAEATTTGWRQFLFLSLVALSLLAPRPSAATPALQVAALRDGESVRVDGVLDEPIWDRAEVVSGLVGTRPSEGFTPRGPTRIRVAASATHLYVSWEARWDEPTRVRANYSRREDINQDDQVAIYLDPFGDGRRAYVFWLNPLGIQQDLVITAEGGFNAAWDTLWDSAGRVVDEGYDVEIAIPFRSIRFPRGVTPNWKVLFKRKFTAHREYASWPATRRDLGPELQQYASLEGIAPERSGIGLEVNGSVVGRASQTRDGDSGELTWVEPSFPETVDPGFGLKWQATPSLALNATLNPDFSQVEADPDQIDNNLRFALAVPERRAFFVEGNELFDRKLLYTRSVVDPLYGVKLSGKQGPLSVAVLHAMDESPAGSFVRERPTPGFTSEDVDGARSFVTYASLGYDLGRRSKVSLAWSDKEVLKDGELHSSYHGLKLAGTFAIDSITTLASGVGLSESGREGGERLLGPMGFLSVEREARNYEVGVGVMAFSPGYRAENAYFTSPDRLQADLWGERSFDFDAALRRLELSGSYSLIARGLGPEERLKKESANTSLELEALFAGNMRASVEATFWQQRYGGADLEGKYVELEILNRGHHIVHAGLGGGLGEAIRYADASLTFQREVNLWLELRPLRRLQVHLFAAVDFLGTEAEDLERLLIYRARVIAPITRALSFRLIAQGRTGEGLSVERDLVESASRLDLSALVTLSPSPGTAIHLGYGQRLVWGLEGDVTTESRDIFIKASGLLRL